MAELICRAELVTDWRSKDLNTIHGDIGTFCHHKGKDLIAFGDMTYQGRIYTNVLAEVIGDPTGGLCDIKKGNYSERIPPHSSVPQKLFSIDGKIYAWIVNIESWDTSLQDQRTRGILNVSEDDGRTFREVWRGRWNGRYVNSAPVTDPINPDKIWIVWTHKFRSGGLFLSATHKRYLDTPGMWHQVSRKPILPANTSDYSVIYDGYSAKFLAGWWEFDQASGGHFRKLQFSYAETMEGKWSEPVTVWDGDFKCDWYQEVRPDLSDPRIYSKLLDRMPELKERDPKLHRDIKDANRSAGYPAVEEVLAKPWEIPYAWEMFAPLNDRRYIYGNASLWVPYSPFLVRIPREYIFRGSTT